MWNNGEYYFKATENAEQAITTSLTFRACHK